MTVALDRFVTIKIVQLAQKYAYHANNYLSAFPGMNVHKWRLLVHMVEWGRHAPIDIAKASRREPAEIIGHLSEMVHHGYLEPSFGGDGVHYQITEKGNELYATLLPFMQNRQSRLIEGPDEEQLSLMHSLLDQLVDNVDGLLDLPSNEAPGPRPVRT